MFYSQPLAIRFGTTLINLLQSGVWTSLDVTVAWVRASGITHLAPALSGFLKNGNAVRITVGIDFDNTTQEGLDDLLALQQYGQISVFVHHNEAGGIFHPKLYLFQNATDAKLIVGSNNLTEAGLYQNAEAGLELDTTVDNQVIVSVRDAIESWRDTKLGLARELNTAFLHELVSHGYIRNEATLKAQSAARRAESAPKKGSAKKLFGSVAVTPPKQPVSTKTKSSAAAPTKKPTFKTTPETAAPSSNSSAVATHTPLGQVLLMRVRKAHAIDRPTQTQIPKEVANAPFFGGIKSVLSVHTGESHDLREASARGIINTLKLEIPEMKHMTDPVVRFERTPAGIQYEVYDRVSAQGKAIMNSLEGGLNTSPQCTKLTRPSSPDRSTLWRFI